MMRPYKYARERQHFLLFLVVEILWSPFLRAEHLCSSQHAFLRSGVVH